MSDGSLSQDEIDALLQGTDTIEMDTGAGAASSPLSDAEKSSFQEMLRGVTESQGSNLSILTGKTVAIGDPTVKVRSPAEITSGQPEDVVDVRVDLTDGLHGEHSYIVPASIAGTVAGLMMGQPGGRAGRGVPVRGRGGNIADHRHGRYRHRQPGGTAGENGGAGPQAGKEDAGAHPAGGFLRHGGLPRLHRGVSHRDPDRGVLAVACQGDPLPGGGQRRGR